MIYPPFTTSNLLIHGDTSSTVNSFFLIRADGRLIRGAEGIVFSSVPDDFSHHVFCKIFVGNFQNRSWWAIGIGNGKEIPHNFHLTLRELESNVDSSLTGITCRAVQLVRFDSINRFCGFCGSKTGMKKDEIAKICSSCGRIVYPRLSPAVIVRITYDDKILLSRSPHFSTGMYSVQAGFVEPGESLEAAVYREVMEEIGIKITKLRYFGSQPWPFPDSLMIGFTARYASGNIRIDGKEIEDARWFDHSDLPGLPGPDSIARTLIENWLSEISQSSSHR